MHIAVCDDNVADRKQMERLLLRESDKRASAHGPLYTDSFGNSTVMLANPFQYDAFYIDMCRTEGETGIQLAQALLEKGVKVPVILCCSQINYREHSFPENVLFLDKPITVSALSQTLDIAQEAKQNSVQLIELREEVDTYYVTEPDILYAEAAGRMLHVFLANGQVVKLLTTASNLFEQLEESYPSIILPNEKTLINIRHIKSFGFHKVEMENGKKFSFSGKCMQYAKEMYDKV